jgi:hypothetical protein
MANPRIKLARGDDTHGYFTGYTQEGGEVLLGTSRKKLYVQFDDNSYPTSGELIESYYSYGAAVDTNAGTGAMDGWFSHWNKSTGYDMFLQVLSKHFTFSSTSSGGAKDVTFLLEGFGDKNPPTVFPMTTHSRCGVYTKSVELYDPINVIWRVTLTVRVLTGSAVTAIDTRMFIVGNGEWRDNDVSD